MGIRRDAADAHFSDCIRIAADWTCQRCGTQYTPPTRALHCAHLWTRRSASIRWHPDAAIALCYGCHQWVDSHPECKERLARRLLGDARYEAARERHRQVVRVTRHVREFIRRHYLGERRRLDALRAEGMRGPLEIVPWD